MVQQLDEMLGSSGEEHVELVAERALEAIALQPAGSFEVTDNPLRQRHHHGILV